MITSYYLVSQLLYFVSGVADEVRNKVLSVSTTHYQIPTNLIVAESIVTVADQPFVGFGCRQGPEFGAEKKNCSSWGLVTVQCSKLFFK